MIFAAAAIHFSLASKKLLTPPVAWTNSTNAIQIQHMETLQKNKTNKPIQYKAGAVYFCETPFFVNKHVLIPRFDTELLVEAVISSMKEGTKILDMCTGSGCIAIVVAKHNYIVTAADISRRALHTARKNAKLNSIQNIRFVKTDLFQAFKNNPETFDAIICNPPYVKTADIGVADKSVLHEPRIALDGGEDGLDFYRKIAKSAHSFLRKDGKLFLEIGYNQGKDVSNILLAENVYKDLKTLKDIQGHDRVIVCKI